MAEHSGRWAIGGAQQSPRHRCRQLRIGLQHLRERQPAPAAGAETTTATSLAYASTYLRRPRHEPANPKPVISFAAPVVFGLLVCLMLLLLNNQVGQLSTLRRGSVHLHTMATMQFESLRFLVGRSRLGDEGSERRRWWLLALAGNGIATTLLLTASGLVYVIGFAPSGSSATFCRPLLPGGVLPGLIRQWWPQADMAQLEQSRKLARAKRRFVISVPNYVYTFVPPWPSCSYAFPSVGRGRPLPPAAG